MGHYSKVNLEDVPDRTQSDKEPAVKTLGYELRAAGEPRPEKMRYNYFLYQPGQAVRRHTQINQEELFFVVEGKGCLEIGNEEVALRAGDTLVVEPGPWRRLIAETEMRVFAVGAPNLPDDVIFEDELESVDDLPEGVPEP
ncbi:cupin domain-containing protein [Halococcus sediminicola]|uniref:cupin domain-containing protein n=1 Tax=Halococcus sediminicola TaxID=1264579 RepID=UPI000678E417|nr:cupin domain-containing protein [Halococcus sediminicola]